LNERERLRYGIRENEINILEVLNSELNISQRDIVKKDKYEFRHGKWFNKEAYKENG
jgi:hypothetical protein